MTGPSPYIPTKSNPKTKSQAVIGRVYDSNGNLIYDGNEENFWNYARDGWTHIGPMLTMPGPWFYTTEGLSQLTVDGNLEVLVENFKKMPDGKRCVGMNFVNSGLISGAFDDRFDFGITNGFGITNYYSTSWITSNYGRTTGTGYASIWPVHGISLGRNYWNIWLDYVKSQGATIDAVYFGAEGSRYSNPNILNGISSDPRYNQTWYGLTAIEEYFNEEKNLRKDNNQNGAWFSVYKHYDHQNMHAAYSEPFLSRYPNSVMSNYLSFNTDRGGNANYVYEDGIGNFPNQGLVGNASGCQLYAMVRQFDREYTVAYSWLHVLDPFTGGFQETPWDVYPTTGPWTSFMMALSELRISKRNALNNPLTPWLPTVHMAYAEYNAFGMNQEHPSWQAPKEVLHQTWYRKNITSTVYGFNGFIGFTGNIGTRGWYGAIPGFGAPDGSTAAIKLDTKYPNNAGGISGAKCELNYYHNGLTNGVTYIFSYYVDLSRGYTNLNINFKTFEPSYSGITFSQTLPLSTGPFNGETPVYFNEGDSGWTKVEWRFNAINNSTLCTSLYCVTNPSGTGGRETWIWNPKLERESTPSNIDLSLVLPYLETDRLWRQGPVIGFADVKKGYNQREALYLTKRGGNSAYYYEMVRHACLMGTRSFGYFNPSSFIDHGVTGTITIGLVGSGTYSGAKQQLYLGAGKTSYVQEFKNLENCLTDVENKIGGFTLATAEVGPINWRAPYMVNGAPNMSGTTWWWRVTVKPGFTMNCYGQVISSSTTPGCWISTNHNDYEEIIRGLTWVEWPRNPDFEIPKPRSEEPGLTAPDKEINFLGMTSNASLKAIGITFTRNSKATYIGSDGYLKVAEINEPRFDYNPTTLQPRGLLLERGATNYLAWSETFSLTGSSVNNWIDTNLTRTYSNLSPSGQTNAIRFTATNNDGILKVTSGMTYIGRRNFSVWLRGITGNEKVYYTIDGGTHWIRVYDLTNKWNRFTFGPNYPHKTAPWNYGITSATHTVGIKLGKIGNSVEMWGAQLEDISIFEGRGLALTSSYIPTGATANSRVSELCYMQDSFVTDWLKQDKGTFVWESENYPVLYFRYPSVSNAGNLNQVMYITYWGGRIPININKNGSNIHQKSVWYFNGYVNNIFPVNTPNKLVWSFDQTGITFSYATTQEYSGWCAGNTGLPLLNTIIWSGSPGGGANVNSISHTRKLRYWNECFDSSVAKNVAESGSLDPYIGYFNPYG